jgi:hypothetical protein
MNSDGRASTAVSRPAEGEFGATLREQVNQAHGRVTLLLERIEAVDDVGVRGAQSRLTYLLRVAAEHGIDIEEPGRTEPSVSADSQAH